MAAGLVAAASSEPAPCYEVTVGNWKRRWLFVYYDVATRSALRGALAVVTVFGDGYLHKLCIGAW